MRSTGSRRNIVVCESVADIRNTLWLSYGCCESSTSTCCVIRLHLASKGSSHVLSDPCHATSNSILSNCVFNKFFRKCGGASELDWIEVDWRSPCLIGWRDCSNLVGDLRCRQGGFNRQGSLAVNCAYIGDLTENILRVHHLKNIIFHHGWQRSIGGEVCHGAVFLSHVTEIAIGNALPESLGVLSVTNVEVLTLASVVERHIEFRFHSICFGTLFDDGKISSHLVKICFDFKTLAL